MPRNDQDRRVIRTRALLRDALIALTRERGYDNITVQDITDRANVNRATFYLHFRDKAELLVQTMQELWDALMAESFYYSAANIFEEIDHVDLVTFQHVADHADFYRVMLSDKGAALFQAYVQQYIAAQYLAILHRLLPPTANPPVSLEATSHYYAGGILGLIRWWLAHLDTVSVEQAALMCSQLERHACAWILGLTPHTEDVAALRAAHHAANPPPP